MSNCVTTWLRCSSDMPENFASDSTYSCISAEMPVICGVAMDVPDM